MKYWILGVIFAGTLLHFLLTPKTLSTDFFPESLLDLVPSSSLSSSSAIPATSIVLEQDELQDQNRRSAIVFVCNEKYLNAVLDSVRSVRVDGGFTIDDGDVILIYDPVGGQRTVEDAREQLRQLESELRTQNQTQTALVTNENSTTMFVYDSTALLQDIMEKHPHYGDVQLQQPPDLAACKEQGNRIAGHRAYYMKPLIYHPSIASQQYSRVLYVDACHTYHYAYLPDLVNGLPEAQNKVLAALDPWRWRRFKMKKELLRCAPQSQLDRLFEILQNSATGKSITVQEAGWFNSAFVLFDTSLVHSYTRVTGDAYSTVVELYRVYHQLGQVFVGGDQLIQSVYWMHIRNKWSSLPLEMANLPFIPYEFVPRLPADHHIVSAGNDNRYVCKSRKINAETLWKPKKRWVPPP